MANENRMKWLEVKEMISGIRSWMDFYERLAELWMHTGSSLGSVIVRRIINQHIT